MVYVFRLECFYVMRYWYKYFISSSGRGIIHQAIDSDYSDHANSMGGYGEDASYVNKETFFKKYYYGYHLNRLEHYDDFLRKHLNKADVVLSIASGRCANELRLTEEGYHIVCSDLESPHAIQSTKKLFKHLDFIEYDVLKDEPRRQYSAVMCLSLIYLFDDKALNSFFHRINACLENKGILILDSAGSEDKWLSNFVHDIALKYETYLYWLLKSIINKGTFGIIKKHHGYRRTNDEIIRCALNNGFEIRDRQDYAFLTEFRRSIVFNLLIPQGSNAEKLFRHIGKRMPYIRMFCFQKTT